LFEDARTMLAMVVDDSRAMRAIICGILREAGIGAVEASQGREALERLQDNPEVQLILVDWNMPVMDGLEFIQAVRARSEYQSVRIMMVTTETESDQVVRALEVGANEYLMKPFTKDVLIAKLSLMNVLEYED
jgi:two-component system chemotaxis response regulator CheY